MKLSQAKQNIVLTSSRRSVRTHREKWPIKRRAGRRENVRSSHQASLPLPLPLGRFLALHEREGQGRSRKRNFPTRYAFNPPEQPVLQAKIRTACQYSHFSALFWRKECNVLRAAPQLTERLEEARCPKTAVHNDYLQS